MRWRGDRLPKTRGLGYVLALEREQATRNVVQCFRGDDVPRVVISVPKNRVGSVTKTVFEGVPRETEDLRLEIGAERRRHDYKICPCLLLLINYLIVFLQI